jgi:hypothetical protein
MRSGVHARRRRKKKEESALGHVDDLIASAPARCRHELEKLNDALLQLVEQEGPVKARGLIFGLLAAATIAELGMRFKELELHADMLARLEQIHDEPIRANVTQAPIFTALPFDEAVDFFRRKQVMTPDEFAQLEDRYKSKGFSMAEVHSRYVLEAAHDALDDAIAKGASESETLKRKSATASPLPASPRPRTTTCRPPSIKRCSAPTLPAATRSSPIPTSWRRGRFGNTPPPATAACAQRTAR